MSSKGGGMFLMWLGAVFMALGFSLLLIGAFGGSEKKADPATDKDAGAYTTPQPDEQPIGEYYGIYYNDMTIPALKSRRWFKLYKSQIKGEVEFNGVTKLAVFKQRSPGSYNYANWVDALDWIDKADVIYYDDVYAPLKEVVEAKNCAHEAADYTTILVTGGYICQCKFCKFDYLVKYGENGKKSSWTRVKQVPDGYAFVSGDKNVCDCKVEGVNAPSKKVDIKK